jgi:uncharacterized membrane protein YdbT with pleckstrin-like domain
VPEVAAAREDHCDPGLVRRGDDLVVTVSGRRRVVALPGALCRCQVAGAVLRDGRLAVRRLLLARTTVLGPAGLRESHAIAQNPLQRQARLADVVVAFGKSTSARVRHLELATARALFDRLGGS